MKKVYSLTSLKKIIDNLKKNKKSIVFTNGCFDILHSGHIKTFKEARKKGNILIVGVNSDLSIKKIKGSNRPILPEKTRIAILEAIEYVNYIVIFNEETPYKVIKTLKPDYLVKGGDWQKDKIIGKEFVKKVFRVALKPGHSTSKIIDTILCRYKESQA